MKTVIRNRSESESGRLSEFRERQLMAEIVDGSELAFQALASELRPLIISMVRRTLGSGSEVDDVCQTVLLSIWKGAARWEPTKGRVSTWVASIARNRAIDHVRKASRATAMRERLSTEAAALAPPKICPHRRRRTTAHGGVPCDTAGPARVGTGTAPSSGARLSRRPHADRGGGTHRTPSWDGEGSHPSRHDDPPSQPAPPPSRVNPVLLPSDC